MLKSEVLEQLSVAGVPEGAKLTSIGENFDAHVLFTDETFDGALSILKGQEYRRVASQALVGIPEDAVITSEDLNKVRERLTRSFDKLISELNGLPASKKEAMSDKEVVLKVIEQLGKDI